MSASEDKTMYVGSYRRPFWDTGTGTFLKAMIITVIVLAVILLLALAFPNGCVDEMGSRSVLRANGFTNIEFTGYRWWGCSEDDQFHTGFTALSPNGTPVSGCVCSGITKAYTIRFDP